MNSNNGGYQKQQMGKDCNFLSLLLLIAVILLGGWNMQLKDQLQHINDQIDSINQFQNSL